MSQTVRSSLPAARPLLLACTALILGCQGAESQAAEEVHPEKLVYADYSEWPATTPGSITLNQFQPFRAVYGRHYTDHNGQERLDRVVVTAERIAWADEEAIAVGLVDTGNTDYPDTYARSHMRFFSAEHLGLLFQLTPAPGAAQDYMVIRVGEESVNATMVESETGDAEHREMPNPGPDWGVPGVWALGSMPLEEGMKIRLDPAFAMANSSVLGTSPYRVVGQEQVSLPNGETMEARVVEYPLGMTNGRIMQLLIVDRPPYLVEKRPYDVDTGEFSDRGSLRLQQFTAFGDQR